MPSSRPPTPAPESDTAPQMRNTLATTLRAALHLPSVIAQRCVHDHIHTARCRACVEACPLEAWVIDDERLGIDINACDGCGLCVPACPEGAIFSNNALADTDFRSWKSHPAIFRACERSDLDTADCRIPCVHSVGMRELLHHYPQGMTTWIITTADCDTCPRGRVQRLAESVRQANALLQSRSLEPIALVTLEPAQWKKILNQSIPYQTGPISTRRDFFRDALRTVVKTTREAAAPTEDQPAHFIVPTAWLPDDLSAVALHSPVIDPLRCNGCDGCVRLCPHQAITLETTPAEPCYRIESRHCTGCGICRDVCDQNAVAIVTLQAPPQKTVPLAVTQCPACAIRYHLPTARFQPHGLCPICAKTRHGRHLYQVLK